MTSGKDRQMAEMLAKIVFSPECSYAFGVTVIEIALIETRREAINDFLDRKEAEEKE